MQLSTTVVIVAGLFPATTTLSLFLFLPNMHRQQSTVKYNNGNPVWNEVFRIPIVSEEYDNKELILQVYDKDKISRDDMIGEYRIKLDELERDTINKFHKVHINNHNALLSFTVQTHSVGKSQQEVCAV